MNEFAIIHIKKPDFICQDKLKLISAAGLKRELLTKNGFDMSVRIKIFSETFCIR